MSWMPRQPVLGSFGKIFQATQKQYGTDIKKKHPISAIPKPVSYKDQSPSFTVSPTRPFPCSFLQHLRKQERLLFIIFNQKLPFQVMFFAKKNPDKNYNPWSPLPLVTTLKSFPIVPKTPTSWEFSAHRSWLTRRGTGMLGWCSWAAGILRSSFGLSRVPPLRCCPPKILILMIYHECLFRSWFFIMFCVWFYRIILSTVELASTSGTMWT